MPGKTLLTIIFSKVGVSLDFLYKRNIIECKTSPQPVATIPNRTKVQEDVPGLSTKTAEKPGLPGHKQRYTIQKELQDQPVPIMLTPPIVAAT